MPVTILTTKIIPHPHSFPPKTVATPACPGVPRRWCGRSSSTVTQPRKTAIGQPQRVPRVGGQQFIARNASAEYGTKNPGASRHPLSSRISIRSGGSETTIRFSPANSPWLPESRSRMLCSSASSAHASWPSHCGYPQRQGARHLYQNAGSIHPA